MFKYRVTTNGERYRIESRVIGFWGFLCDSWRHIPFSGTYDTKEMAIDQKLRLEQIQSKNIAQGKDVWRCII